MFEVKSVLFYWVLKKHCSMVTGNHTITHCSEVLSVEVDRLSSWCEYLAVSDRKAAHAQTFQEIICGSILACVIVDPGPSLYLAELSCLYHWSDVSSPYFHFSNRPVVGLESSVFGFGGRCHWKDTASHR